MTGLLSVFSILSAIEFDLASLGGLKGIGAAILALIGSIAIGSPLMKKIPGWLKPFVLKLFGVIQPVVPVASGGNVGIGETTIRSSDQAPPDGFVAHLQIIKVAAPAGNEAVWWSYALKGFTEAQVAKAEAALVSRKSVAPPPVVPGISSGT